MLPAPVYDFPPFDTGRFAGAEFLLSGGNARLLIKVEEHSDIVRHFNRVRWHEFTATYNCSVEQFKSAYFELLRLDDSARLKTFIMTDRATSKAYTKLHHFRVFLEGHGGHELFAESYSAVPDSGRWDKAD